MFFSECPVALTHHEQIKNEKIKRPDFKVMNSDLWEAFDSDLWIRIEESRQERYETPQSTDNMGKSSSDSHEKYEQISKLVGESIEKVVSSKTWTKKWQNRIINNKDLVWRKNSTISKG